MRTAARVDVNQADMVKVWRGAGLHVAYTYQLGGGFPDTVVTGYCLRLNAVVAALVEIKFGNDKLTAKELEWHAAYPDGGPLIIARVAADVLAWFGRVD